MDNKNIVVYKIRVGDKWAGEGSRPTLSDTGKMWKKRSHVKSHFTHAQERMKRSPDLTHPYKGKNKPEVVAFELHEVKENRVCVSMPTDDPVLADLLENYGFGDIANQLRGV